MNGTRYWMDMALSALKNTSELEKISDETLLIL
jgi:hypothetical protein